MSLTCREGHLLSLAKKVADEKGIKYTQLDEHCLWLDCDVDLTGDVQAQIDLLIHDGKNTKRYK